MELTSLRARLLAARDDRAATIARLSAALRGELCLVFLSLNVPGPGKTARGLDGLFDRARRALVEQLASPPASAVEHGRDALGPWAAITCPGTPGDVKKTCVAIEESRAGGRLTDLDVFGPDGRQVDRRSLGLPPRRCLVCSEAAVDCIRTGRHAPRDLGLAVARLVHADECSHLADALARAARIELELTPKPGLVDRLDNGSHPELSFERMSRSIDLLPEYYGELLGTAGQKACSTAARPRAGSRGTGLEPCPLDLDACIGAGLRAERRMLDAIGTNAHRGYIFLSGLVLLGFAVDDGRHAWPGETAAGAGVARRDALRRSIAGLARRILARSSGASVTNGARARALHGVGGIHAEALAGLPAVFGHGLPALDRAAARFGDTDRAYHYLMAVLMAAVEDTTALHRCGRAGLERLREDGHRVRAAIDEGQDPSGLLASLNEDYRALGLTMGGVADCMAITIALRPVAKE